MSLLSPLIRRSGGTVSPVGMADFSLVPRSAWVDPAKPVTGLAPVLEDIQDFVVHYMGTDLADLDIDNDGDVDRDDTFAMLRSIQAAYLRDPNRGYSIGYNTASSFAGNAVEVHGLTLRNAANSGSESLTGHKNHNQYSVSHLILGDIDDDITDAQKDSTALTLLHIESALERELNIKGHRNVDGTSCPGDLIYSWLGNLREHALDILNDELGDNHDADVFDPQNGSYGLWLVRIAFALEGMPVLRPNHVVTVEQHTAVRFLKGYLMNEMGFDIPKADGRYGPVIQEHVKTIKRYLGFEKADSVVGPAFWAMIGIHARKNGV